MEQQLDRNFVFPVNLAGAKPYVPGATLEPGFYLASCKDWGATQAARKDGSGSFVVCRFALDINGADRSADVYAPDASATAEQQESNRRKWRTVAESAGYEPSQIEGQVTLGAGAFVGRTFHIEVRKREYTKNDGSTGQADDILFWAPANWKQAKEAAEKAAAAGPQTKVEAKVAETPRVQVTPPVVVTPAAGNGAGAPTLNVNTLLGLRP